MDQVAKYMNQVQGIDLHPILQILVAGVLVAIGYFVGRQSMEGFSNKKKCRPIKCPPCPPMPDLSKYVLKSSIPPCAPQPDMSKYMLKSECPAKPDMSKYILKSKVPPCPPCITGCTKPCAVGKCPPCPRPRCPVPKPCPRVECAPCPACPAPRCPEPEVKCQTVMRKKASVRPFLSPIF